MKPNDYLKSIIAEQTFEPGAPELDEIRARRMEIDAVLRSHFSGSNPSIRWAGSMAKRTMIRDSYDGDMTCYFPHDESEAGETLAEIYENTVEALARLFIVEKKPSAIRVRDKELQTDLHIDVVPGRFTGNDQPDVFLHRTTGDKQRLKTNLQVHIDHIRDSNVIDAIRLMKLWNVRHGVGAKTFVLELLVVKLLSTVKTALLTDQLLHVWTEFRDNAGNLAVEDPANLNNDLKPILDQCRSSLTTISTDTLWQIENSGWEAVFGYSTAKSGGDGGNRTEELKVVAASATIQTRPWLAGS